MTTTTVSSGAAGDIIISTGQLIVSAGSGISALTEGSGQGGQITIDAFELVQIGDTGQGTQIATQSAPGAIGNAGDVIVTTGRLILQSGGQISSSTSGTGNGGTVVINASESVQVLGQGKSLNGDSVASGLFAQTLVLIPNIPVTGNSGDLIINTGDLIVQDGGQISAAAIDGSLGQAGTLEINASESVTITGPDSTLLTASESLQPAGDLTINTGNLLVQNGASIAADSSGTGAGGSILIDADAITLDNEALITAMTDSSMGGDIFLNVGDVLLLKGGSSISTTAGIAEGSGDGGSIDITADFIVATPNENNDITANAFSGDGGKVEILTFGVFGFFPRSIGDLAAELGTSDPTALDPILLPTSDITAISQGDPAVTSQGTVVIQTIGVDPSQSLVDLPANVIDVVGLVDQNLCQAGKGSEFIATGREGLPPSPINALNASSGWEDLRIDDFSEFVATTGRPASGSAAVTTELQPQSLEEAQGMMIAPDGTVMLTARPVAVTPQGTWLHPLDCQRLRASRG
ncbi:MAG: S-layer family protein [Cyanothece sp. SIO1E1]|nr:S-layer family protein [Cyanothece sp. SIO1E1]